MQYNKSNPNEEINIGDLIVLDLTTGNVTKTKDYTLEEYIENSPLVVGVCNGSDNTTTLPKILDCR